MWNPIVTESVWWGLNIELRMFGFMALIVALFIFPSYILAMTRGEQKPPKSTWLLYLVMDALTFATRLGDGVFDPMLFAFTVGTAFVVLFVAWYGTKGWTLLDTCCSVIVGLAPILWMMIGSTVATICSLGAITVATLPLLKHVWQGAYEDRRAWSIAICSSFFNLLDGHVLVSIWYIALQALVVGLVLYHWGLTRKPAREVPASA